MSRIEIYHHDPVEVDTSTSWTGLCSEVAGFTPIDVKDATDSKVLALFDYARPDAVVVVDGQPVVSLEQTMMNPSGHNIPQRFSCLVRASELSVPSIMYCPESARRTFSDPNPRYMQVRVPMGQIRLTELFGVPSLTIFWPTGADLLPRTDVSAHQTLADVIGAMVRHRDDLSALTLDNAIVSAQEEMRRVISDYGLRYRKNRSVRSILPNGFSPPAGISIAVDPANTTQCIRTEEFLGAFHYSASAPSAELAVLLSREHTLVFTGTANKDRTDSEHPWPGYLTLLDVLYLRTESGITQRDRRMNLVYVLPDVFPSNYVSRMNRAVPPTATYITDTFSDAIVLGNELVHGRPIRGSSLAKIVARR